MEKHEKDKGKGRDITPAPPEDVRARIEKEGGRSAALLHEGISNVVRDESGKILSAIEDKQVATPESVQDISNKITNVIEAVSALSGLLAELFEGVDAKLGSTSSGDSERAAKLDDLTRDLSALKVSNDAISGKVGEDINELASTLAEAIGALSVQLNNLQTSDDAAKAEVKRLLQQLELLTGEQGQLNALVSRVDTLTIADNTRFANISTIVDSINKSLEIISRSLVDANTTLRELKSVHTTPSVGLSDEGKAKLGRIEDAQASLARLEVNVGSLITRDDRRTRSLLDIENKIDSLAEDNEGKERLLFELRNKLEVLSSTLGDKLDAFKDGLDALKTAIEALKTAIENAAKPAPKPAVPEKANLSTEALAEIRRVVQEEVRALGTTLEDQFRLIARDLAEEVHLSIEELPTEEIESTDMSIPPARQTRTGGYDFDDKLPVLFRQLDFAVRFAGDKYFASLASNAEAILRNSVVKFVQEARTADERINELKEAKAAIAAIESFEKIKREKLLLARNNADEIAVLIVTTLKKLYLNEDGSEKKFDYIGLGNLNLKAFFRLFGELRNFMGKGTRVEALQELQNLQEVLASSQTSSLSPEIKSELDKVLAKLQK